MKEIILNIGITNKKRFLNISDIEMLRNIVDNYSPTRDFFIGDLSLFSEESLSVLLKFLEEKVQGVFECYASKDNLNATLLSRFTKINKREILDIGTGTFLDFVSYSEDRNDSVVFLETSPTYLDSYLVYGRLSRGIRERIQNLL